MHARNYDNSVAVEVEQNCSYFPEMSRTLFLFLELPPNAPSYVIITTKYLNFLAPISQFLLIILILYIPLEIFLCTPFRPVVSIILFSTICLRINFTTYTPLFSLKPNYLSFNTLYFFRIPNLSSRILRKCFPHIAQKCNCSIITAFVVIFFSIYGRYNANLQVGSSFDIISLTFPIILSLSVFVISSVVPSLLYTLPRFIFSMTFIISRIVTFYFLNCSYYLTS